MLDRALRPAPIGVPGELCLSGAGLARGYLGRPGRTASSFVPDPFTALANGGSGPDGGGRLYRTGDLARRRPDGQIEFLGRLDHQVKLRGFRIELGEIEAALVADPRVAEAVVAARSRGDEGGTGGETLLVAYVVPARAMAADDLIEALRGALGERLPAYMVPAAFEVLDALPLTPNGKVDRKALPEPSFDAGTGAEGDGAALSTQTEERLAALFAEVLGLPPDRPVGRNEDFFRLGGHSLLATRLVARVNETFGTEVPVRTVFDAPTVAGLAREIAPTGRAVVPAATDAIPRRDDSSVAPLSFAQRRFWFLHQLDPESAADNVSQAVELEGALDPAALAAALGDLAARHETLRTALVEAPAGPVQAILPAGSVRPALPVVDLSRLDRERGRGVAHEIAVAEAARPVAIDRAPLMRTTTVRLAATEHLLVLVLHHAVADGWSLGVLLRELSACYGARSAGHPATLEPLPIQYGDFAIWQRRRLEEARLDRLLDWWRHELAGAPAVLELPFDRPRHPGQDRRAGTVHAPLPQELVEHLEAFGRERSATLFMVLLAGFEALLGRLSGQDDLVLGTPNAGRDRAELEGLIGMFVDTVALRARLGGESTVDELVERVRTTVRSALDHHELPFDRLVAELAPERSRGVAPLVQVLLVLQNAPLGPLELPGLRLERQPLGGSEARFDLEVALEPRARSKDGGLLGIWRFRAARFDPTTVQRMARQLRTLLEAMVAEPGRRLAELPLLTSAQTQQVVVEWNDTGPVAAVGERLDARFRSQAARTPDAIALLGATHLSYDALARRTAALARRLRAAGVGPRSGHGPGGRPDEVRVAVCLPRTADMVVALLAVLEAGGAYVPLDATYPQERLAFMLEDSGATVVLASEETRACLNLDRDLDRLPTPPVVLDPSGPTEPSGPTLPAEPEDTADDLPAGDALAYLIYTSGSTGKPKGVAVSHGAAGALLDWAAGVFSAGELRGVLAGTSICFDLSFFELFLPLTSGGRIVLADDALGTADHLDTGEVTLVNTVPSVMKELADAGALPESVRTVNLAGEPLQRSLVDAIYERFPGVERVYDLYGPSEDTTYSTFARIDRPAPGRTAGQRADERPAEPPIGLSVAGSRAHVLDRQLRPSPIGVPGELCLAGAGLARGYLERPGRTAASFVPDPFATGASPGGTGGRLYRTGDLARRRPDGALEFLGRLDHQVKIRGFRIELGEIENALAADPRVDEAAVAAPLRAGEPLLVAYVVPTAEGRSDREPDAGGDTLGDVLRLALADRLPRYMVPALFVELDALPRTTSGKVDRSALPEPGWGRAEPGQAPISSLEELLASLFAEVLGLGDGAGGEGNETVGRTDDFFRLGGNSLLATRLTYRLRDLAGIDVPVAVLFEAPTIAELADQIEAAGSEGAISPAEPLAARSTAWGEVPLSFAQRRIWFLHQLDPEAASYNMPGALSIEGPLCLSILARSLGDLMDRHETLRTALLDGPAGPVQKVSPVGALRPELPVVDLSGLGETRRRRTALRLADAEAARPVAIDRAPLIRTTLFRLEPTEHVLAVVLHHAIADGWSLGVFIRETSALYSARHAGTAAALPPLPVQYCDFALWQRRRLAGRNLDRLLDWWRSELDGAPKTLELPFDRPRRPDQTSSGETVTAPLSVDLVARLESFGRDRSATLFMVLLAGFEALLARLSGQDDFVLGTPSAGRDRRELEGLIGMLVDTVALRARLGDDPSVDDLVDRARTTALKSFTHQELPFDRLVAELVPERGRGIPPLIQVLLALQEKALETPQLPELRLEHLPLESGTAKFDLELALEPRDGTLLGAWNFSTALFDATTVQRMAEQHRTLLEAMLADPERRLSELPLLTCAQRQQLLVEWNDAVPGMDPGRGPAQVQRPAGSGHLDARFRAQAARRPDAIALVARSGTDGGGERLSYGELARRAAALAGRLRAAGVGVGSGPEVRVGVCLPREPQMVVALLAVLEAGGAYVPLDPDYPQERLAFMLEDSAAPVVLVSSATRERLPLDRLNGGRETPLVVLDAGLLDGPPTEAPAVPPSRDAEPSALDALAYLIYTSGSTGRPKGIAVSHRAAGDLLDWAASVFSTDVLAGVLAGSSICFDLSVFEIFLPLATGGRIVLAADALGAADYRGTDEVTLVNTVPSAIKELVAAGTLPASVRTVTLAGERLQRSLVDALSERFPGVQQVYNLYGPSEHTTSTFVRVDQKATDEPTIGGPVATGRAYVLDRDLRPVPIGVPGELCLAGAGLARGYLGRPARTARSFVPDPFTALAPIADGGAGPEAGGRLYRTGDMARRRADGRLEFLGRLDHQVKLRGFRIELGEIEAALVADPRVAEAVVATRRAGADDAAAGSPMLVAYVVPCGEAATTGDPTRPERTELVEVLRTALGERLPAFMVPAAFEVLDALPLTPNGKVDRRALPEPSFDTGTGVGDPGAAGATGRSTGSGPSNATEERLAALFTEILSLPAGRPVGRHEDFFRLGGHSLLATRLVSRIRSSTGYEIPVAALFETPTVAGLARRLDAERPASTPAGTTGPERATPPIPRRPDLATAPLTYPQERLWFLARLDPEASTYNMPGAVRMAGRLDLPVLAGALDALVARHEALRTEIVEAGERGDTPLQRIHPPGAVRATLPVVDLTGLPEDRRRAESRRLVARDARRPVALTEAPLLRTTLIRAAPADHVVSVVMHHVVSDGWSLGVFVAELSAVYGAGVAGRKATLPPLPIQYGDFALWHRQRLTEEVQEELLGWWREELNGAPTVLDLPTDRPRPLSPTGAGGVVRIPLPPGLAERLDAFARDHGATLFMVLLAGFGAFLARTSGRRDLIVGTPNAGRDRSELERLIGLFVETVALRLRLDDPAGSPSLTTLVERARDTSLGAFAHQQLPFDRLVEALDRQRNRGVPPLVQVMLALQNAPMGPLELPGLRLERLASDSGTAKFDLTVSFEPLDPTEPTGSGGAPGLLGVWSYSSDLFDATTIRRMAGHLHQVFETLVEQPERPVDSLPLLTPTERHQLFVEWNDEPWPVAPEGGCLHHLIERWAERTPDAVAVVFEDRRLTYGALLRRSGLVAAALRERGVGPDSLVGLCMERSIELAVGVLGILLSGAAYVPLDPAYPQDRIEVMIDEAGLDWVVTRHGDGERLEATAAAPLWVDEAPDPSATSPAPTTRPTVHPDNAAYAIFTSGSTGRPKGVVVSHRSVANRLLYAADHDPVGRGTALLKASICFDLSVGELFSALVAGTRVVLARPGGHGDMDYLLNLIARERIVQTSFLPSQLSVLMEQPDLDRLDSMIGMMTGGEAVPPTLPERLAERADLPLYNRYGPTETTLSVTSWRCEHERDVQTIPIGRRIGGATIYMLGPGLRPVPAAVPGELCIGGVCVARGYLNRPRRTAEAFVPDPLSATPGARLYRSGDLARWRPDGVVEFLGRIDQQVKIRGFRIELGEIEAVLVQHPEVLEAAVVDCDEEGSENRRLAAYLVLDPDAAPETDALRAFVGDKLPAYMVPAAFEVMDELPLTSSGKVDRRRLPEPRWDTESRRAYVAPRTPTEERMAGLFAEVLEAERVGVEDDFFELGGHSLLATRLVARVRTAFDVELPLRLLFETPTVCGLAAAVEALVGGGGADEAPALGSATEPTAGVPPFERAEEREDGVWPASFAQERLWFLSRLDPTSAAYHMPRAMRITGALLPAALAAALEDVVRRHATLRTVFDETLDGVIQRIRPAGALGADGGHRAVPLPVIDLRALPDGRRHGEAIGLARRVAAVPFDLTRDLLLRAALIRLETDRHVAAFSMHHIASDGWSVGVLVRELAAFYRARLDGPEGAAAARLADPAGLPALPIRYVDFAVWQRSWLRGPELERRLAWWKELLDGAPAALELPLDRTRPPVQTFRGGELHTVLGGRVGLDVEGIERLARRLDATPYMVLLASLAALLGRSSRQDDVVLGSPTAGRSHQEIEGLIGFFVNTLALRVDLSGDPTFAELVGRVKEMALGAFAHQDLPFERLVEEVAPTRNLSSTPLFQVLFAFQNTPRERLEIPGATIEPERLPVTAAKFDLTFDLDQRNGRIAARLEYNRDLFDATTVLRLARGLGTLLAAAVAAPDEHLSRLELLGPAERHLLFAEWSDGGAPIPGGSESSAGAPEAGCLHRLIREQVGRTPEAEALVAGAERWTYADLAARSGTIAGRLRAAGVGPETRVGVFAERSPALVAALLGVLEAGGTYVPLDPGYPPERIAFMLEDSAAAVVLADADLAARLPADGLPRPPAVLTLDELLDPEAPAAPTEEAAEDRPTRVDPRQLAYLIYTSGSTGRPKGVAISHASAVAMVRWAGAWFPAEALAGVLAATSVCFDLSVYELFVPLAHGGKLILARDALELAALAEGGEIRLVNTVPSVMRELLAASALPRSVCVVNLAGEPLKRALADAVFDGAPAGTALFNLYGPSEDTTYSTAARVPQEGGEPTIGRPIAGSRAYVVDPAGPPESLCPVGVPGELCLAGLGLARGYLGRPARTAQSFVPDPFAGSSDRRTGDGGRLYRTGDLVRWRRDGELEFLGRLDHQVKVRGFRIELGEIEATLTAHPEIAEAVVTVYESPHKTGEGRDLVGYLVPAEGAAQGASGEGDDEGEDGTASLTAAARAWLQERLPGYMVPPLFVELDELPRTSSGKIDRTSLPEPEASRAGAAEAYEPPETDLEVALAELWTEVLEVERIGIHDDFFSLGGHSLKATQVLLRVRDAFGVELPVRRFFEQPTIAGLSVAVVETLLAEADEDELADAFDDEED